MNTIEIKEPQVFRDSNLQAVEDHDIPHIDINEVTYWDFFENYLFVNKPCILRSVSNNWVSSKYWVADNKPNFDYLLENYKEAQVPVADCADKYYNSQKKENKTVESYLSYWKEYIDNGYPSSMPSLYLKDWHFTKDFPEENIYRVPMVFASDWLNEYFAWRKDVSDDYRFVYMGPKYTWTPLHADVFTSFSWSANICGRKRWKLFPPGQEEFLKDKFGKLAYDVNCLKEGDTSEYPNVNKLSRFYDIIQEAGEAIFVPSGWHHQVWNLEDTISINHNWVNGCNIKKMWQSISSNLLAVKKEISDCRDMEDWSEDCQRILNATYGMDYFHFYQFLKYIAEARIEHLSEHKPLTVYGDWQVATNHIVFDLVQVKNVLNCLISDEDFKSLPFYDKEQDSILNIINNISGLISEFSL